MKRALAALLVFCIAVPAGAAWREPLRVRHAVVASTSDIASRVGADVMKRGGNAFDAAVAVGFALAVTWPRAGNLGGGGFMLIRTADGKSEAIDYRETAPAAATHDMFVGPDGKVVKGLSVDGYKSIAIPGTVAGLALLHQRHGKLKWAELVEPARKLAANGFPVNYTLASSMKASTTIDKFTPFAESRRIYQRDGRFYEQDEVFRQPELAATLARIARNPRDFYEGRTAQRIVDDMKAHGGLITAEDLRTYRPVIREPLHGTYRGFEVITMPPPSSGGIALIEMFHMLEQYDLKSMGWHSSQHVHTMVEVMRRAFADRAQFLGDPDFVKIPMAGLTSRAYALDRMKSIDPQHATPSAEVSTADPLPYEPLQTTHYSIVDSEGNAVSSTYTLNDTWGSGVTVKGTGILLNDEMDDFTAQPGAPNIYELIQGETNAIAPHKRPLSSMTPTMVLQNEKFWFAVGSPGGPTIINTVLQVISNVVDFGMNLQEAVEAPRFHHQWLPDQIYWEKLDLQADTRAALERMGHHFRATRGFSTLLDLGDAHAVMIEPESGLRIGASDSRLAGQAAGW